MGIFDNLLEGIKQGYSDSGGVTPANLFSGPTPREGDAPAGFVGGAGDFLGSLFGHVSSLALRTLPDIIKNPESFIDERGHLSPLLVLDANSREENEKARKMDADIKKSALAASVINQGNDLLKAGHDTLTSPAARALMGKIFGENDPRVQAVVDASNADSATYRTAGLASGLLPAVADIADANSAQAAGQSQFTDRLAREQNVQQAGLTRGNQANEAALQRQTHKINEDVTTTSLKQRLLDAKALKETPDPYTPLAALNEAGAFDSNPAAKIVANAHLSARTDPGGAARFLNAYQSSTVAPTRSASGITGRRDQAALDNLNGLLQQNLIAEADKPLAASTLAAGDAAGARKIIDRKLTPLTAAKAGEDYLLGASQFVNDPNGGFKDLPPEIQARLAGAVEAQDNVTAKGIMSTINKVGLPTTAKVLSSPEVKEVQKQQDILSLARPRLDAAYESAKVPGDPDHIDLSLFSPLMSHFTSQSTLLNAMSLIAPTDLTTRKAALMANAGDSLNTYLKRFGTRIPQAEADRFKTIWVTGNEPSAAIFNAKHAAISAAMERDDAILAGQFQSAVDAASSMNPKAVLGLKATQNAGQAAALEASRKQLAFELAHAEANPDNQSSAPLTDEEKAQAAALGIK